MEIKTVGECFYQIRNGANIKQGGCDGGYPITRIETIANNKFNRDRMGYAGITDLGKYQSYVLEDGDLLMSHINSIQYLGRTVLYEKPNNDERIIHGMNLLCMKADKDIILPSYARYFFCTHYFREQIRTITKKSVNQASFAVTDLKKLNILVFPINEQKRIVNTLDGVKKVIALRQQELQKLDGLVKARFVEMFGTETELDKWHCGTVSDVADVCVGVVIKPTQYYANQGVPAFRSLNIGEMHVKDADWVYFTEEGHRKNQKSVVRENDVLVVRSGAPGTACVATEKYVGYNAVDIIIAHPDNNKVNSIFLAAFTNMPHGMNQIRAKTGGAAQQHFNVGGYKSMRLIMPPLELQEQFAAFVKQANKSKDVIQKALDEAQLLFDSLMQKYFGCSERKEAMYENQN